MAFPSVTWPFRKAQAEALHEPRRLHIGCGQQAIPGWINIDSRVLPEVDRILDVRRGLPYRQVQAIYAEHFLEHLELREALAFLHECHRALTAEGILRISTPNLDWVLRTHYHLLEGLTDEAALRDCFDLNRAFHGWGHRFLYNRAMLCAVLKSAGFRNVVFHHYGASETPFLRGLERHEQWEDTQELPHVLIVEASGRAPEEPLPANVRAGYEEPRLPWEQRLRTAVRVRAKRLQRRLRGNNPAGEP